MGMTPLKTGTVNAAERAATIRIFAIALVAIFVAAPILATIAGSFSGNSTQGHLWSINAARYLLTTVTLCSLVGLGVAALGGGAALITTLTDFPGRRYFEIGLVLPFAIPAYVAAYAYADFFGPFGLIASLFGAGAAPEIRTLAGAAFILVLATYPYVYLAMRASLAARSSAFMEAARMLGASPMRAALKVLLAVGRPALIGGLALALMETAADYGVADFFGVPTLSVGIFRTWFGLGDLVGATQLAVGLFLLAVLLILIEESSRRGRTMDDVKAHRGRARLHLSRLHAGGAIIACSLPMLFGFVIPAGVLIGKLDLQLTAGAARGLTQAVMNTSLLAVFGATIATSVAILLAYAARQTQAKLGAILLRVATLGYAIPGAVIAIGILALTAPIGRVSGVAIVGGVAVMLYAYVARFLTASYNATTGGLQQISPQMDAAARSLGAGPARILKDIHWPQMRGAALAGAAIVAIDIAKELPATLLLRSFNFETLSTHIYRLASDERLADAAPAALILIVLGLIPAIALSVFGGDKKARRSNTASAGENTEEI